MEADDELAQRTTIASLPHALLARVLARVPVDTRLRCAEVCRGWRDVLAERSLWAHLDLAAASGVTDVGHAAIATALLRAASAKARGSLQTLNISDCEFWWGVLVEVLAANAGALVELRVDCASVTNGFRTEELEELLQAAPRLRQLVTSVYCYNAEQTTRMLRNEGVFAPLRIHDLWLPLDGEEWDAAAFIAVSAALGVHASPLNAVRLEEAALDEPGVLDALADGALANRLGCFNITGGCALSPPCVPALARMLTGSALTRLFIDGGDGVQLLDVPAAALLGSALRANTTLHTLSLHRVRLWDDPLAAGTLLTSLIAHPSLRELSLSGSEVTPAAAESLGAILFALVAANTPALQTLDFGWNSNGLNGMADAALGPLMEALPRNTHLRKLMCGFNGPINNDHARVTEAFARERLLPAVRANTSLLQLERDPVWNTWDAVREAVDFVRRRTAERQLVN
jgi:hypothetical protein